ncbi:hypothetical protein O0I10_008956 [Lichtheimia ornata]|uniref:Gaa1-domain-containing protein n=1 Tax=Lichtheimia ornata TaxID=688661 RepID=A0AAD7XZ76_9FUNG|nr:uncharacterized protein O0I10_008956 [Lichtheimia ornata]KAJ8655462.1 hypothetical protein O0I10_008956 [Lichtheimia ornata]
MLRTWIKRRLARKSGISQYNAAQRERIAQRIQKFVPPLSLLLFFVGIGWILLFPLQEFNRRTYISENALLPGQANAYYGYDDMQIAENYRYELKDVQNKDSETRGAWIQTEFQRMGFTSTIQRFDLDGEKGVNAFAVYRAPRSDGKEALVLSAPWISRTNDYNTNGVAVLLSLAKLFKRNVYWSKDIIFLVTDKEMAGAQAWVDAYHGTGDQDGFSVVMPRSGAIQGVVNLDFPGTHDYESLGIFFEGVNGQLPNLDLINTINTVTNRLVRVPLTLHEETSYPFRDTAWADYFESLYHMLRTMRYQALGHPSSDAGLYLRYKIDAVTIHGIRGSTHLNALFGFFKIGILIESTFRSLNNLLEHFHQSFFFYLLLKPNRYVSIAANTVQKASPTTIPPAYTIRGRNVSFAFLVMIMTHLAGFVIFYIMQCQGYASENLESQFILSTCVAHALVICSFIWMSLHPSLQYDGRILKSFCLAFSGLVISTVSLLNFSLAVVTAICIVLPYSLIRSTSSWLGRVVQLVMLTMLSPCGLALMYVTITGQSLGELLSIMIRDYQIVDSWLLLYICIGYWPTNMAMQIVVFSNP